MAEIRCPLYEAALISKHEAAVVSDERTLLYYELDDMASSVAARLQMDGCAAGDRIALRMEPGWQYVVALMGILRLGAVACPMNLRVPARGLARQLAAIRCSKLIAPRNPDFPEQLAGVRVMDPDALLTPAAGEARFKWNQHMELDRPATILFTSGSNGQPRAVLHTFGNHYYSARGSNVNIRVRSHDHWLLSLPLYHVGGLGILFRCILGGAAIAMPNPGESVEEAQDRLGVSHLSLVATQLYRWMKNGFRPAPNPRLKAILLGGSAVNAKLLEAAQREHLPIYMSYGMTEMSSQVCTVAPDTPPAKRLTSGLPLKYRQVRVTEEGEILVKGATLFAGYVEGDGVEAATDEQGWFATGDMGCLDAEGYLTVTGRKDNLFISGGENIQPEEIEKQLHGLAGVEEAIVVPVSDEEFGFRPVAFVRMRNGQFDSKHLAAELGKILPKFKVPDVFLPWPERRQDDGLKIDRAYFRALAEEHVCA